MVWNQTVLLLELSEPYLASNRSHQFVNCKIDNDSFFLHGKWCLYCMSKHAAWQSIRKKEKKNEIDTRVFSKLEIEKQSFYANLKKSEEIAILWCRLNVYVW